MSHSYQVKIMMITVVANNLRVQGLSNIKDFEFNSISKKIHTESIVRSDLDKGGDV